MKKRVLIIWIAAALSRACASTASSSFYTVKEFGLGNNFGFPVARTITA
jgi:hypothetical protein